MLQLLTGKYIKIFHERKSKSNMFKISITSDNNAFFLVIILVRFFNRKRRDHLKLCYLAVFLIVIFLLKFQIKDEFLFIFFFAFFYKNVRQNEFFNLVIITSCHYFQHIKMHKNLVCLVISI